MKVDHDWLKIAALGLAIAVLIGLAYGVRDTRTVSRANQRTVNESSVIVNGGRTTRIAFQARETFLLCSRSPVGVVDPAKRAAVAEVCRGYETPEAALATEQAKQNQADAAARKPRPAV